MPFVNGVFMALPGVNVSLDTAGIVSVANFNGIGNLFIGSSTDGEPNTPLNVSSASVARQTLKGGDGLQAVLFAIDNGAYNVNFVRVDPATQGTSVINAATGSVVGVNLTTTSYGVEANQSRWMLQAGTTSGYEFEQATDFVGVGGQTYPTSTINNVGLNVFSLYYTGTLTTVTASVTDSEFTVVSTVAGVVTTIASIALTTTLTVQALVNQLNVVSDFTAVLLDPSVQDTTAAFFDNVTSVAVGTSSATATTFTANVTALVLAINNANAYFTATRAANASALTETSAWTYAVGGTTPAATTADWQNAYTTAQTMNGIDIVVPVSSSIIMWQMNDTHCHYMSSIGRPRRGYLGDESGQELSVEEADALGLNSNRSVIIWPEQSEVLMDGTIAVTAPYLLTGIIVGMRSKTPAFKSLTQSVFPSFGAGQQVGFELAAEGVDHGVAVIGPNQSGEIVLERERTTWLQSPNIYLIENESGLIIDLISKDVNANLSQFIGFPASPADVGAASSVVFNRLNYYYKVKWIMAKPVRSDVNLAASGDTITGSFQAAIDIPTNYISVQIVPIAG